VKRLVVLFCVSALLVLSLALPASAIDLQEKDGASLIQGECRQPAQGLEDTGPYQGVYSPDHGDFASGLSTHCNAQNPETSVHEPGSGPAEGAYVATDTCHYDAQNQSDTGPQKTILTPSGEYTQICNAH